MASQFSSKRRRFQIKLEKELDGYCRRGVTLYMNGVESTPHKIAKACIIAERGGEFNESPYMRCFVTNDDGLLESIEFDLINEI